MIGNLLPILAVGEQLAGLFFAERLIYSIGQKLTFKSESFMLEKWRSEICHFLAGDIAAIKYQSRIIAVKSQLNLALLA